MAKARKSVVSHEVASSVDVSVLSAIAAGNITHISQSDGLPLLQNDPPLIEVNTNDIVNGNAAVRLTQAGVDMVPVANAPIMNGTAKFPIISGFVQPPAKKRGKGGGGAPTQYPFATLEVGGSFYVPNTADMPNALKTMGSTVSSKNMHYSEETDEKHEVVRTKRGKGNKALLDAEGNKIKETVIVAVRKPTRKFEIRGVEAGVKYGEWTCPQSGAVITRVL